MKEIGNDLYGFNVEEKAEMPVFLNEINLTSELSQLLEFVSRVAIAIRMNSNYNRNLIYSPDVLDDVMWLSNCLHNLFLINAFIKDSDKDGLLRACDDLIKGYEYYQRADQGKAAFERHEKHFKLSEGIIIFQKIKNKIKGVTS